MKRYLAISAILTTSLFAATDTQIMDYLKSQISAPDIKIEITKRDKLKGNKNYESVTIKVGKEGRFQELTLFTTKGNVIFPDIIDTQKKKSYLKELEQNQRHAKLKKIYSNEDKNNIITLGNDKNKETLIIFTDPECPYCRQELNEIEERLKKNNLKLIMTPVHGKSSLEKSYIIYNEIKKAKNDKTKIDILKKYYAKDVNISGIKVTDDNVKAIEKLRGKYLNGIIKGVPAIIPEKDVK